MVIIWFSESKHNDQHYSIISLATYTKPTERTLAPFPSRLCKKQPGKELQIVVSFYSCSLGIRCSISSSSFVLNNNGNKIIKKTNTWNWNTPLDELDNYR